MSNHKSEVLDRDAPKVLATPPASPAVAHNHFLFKLSFETDPSDVYHDITDKISGMVVIDARTPETYARGHVPGAVNMPHRTIDSTTTASLPRDKVFVPNCVGVFGNVYIKVQGKLTARGYNMNEVREGIEGGRKEGY